MMMENFRKRMLGRLLDYHVKSGAHSKKDLREKLGFLFDFRDHIDSLINKLSVEYYGGKHPKHHLWTNHYKFILDSVLDGETVLDVGCGTSSSYLIELARRGNKIDACDKDAEKIEWNLRNAKIENVTYIVLDITKELPGKKYEVVIFSHILEHLDNPESLLRKVKKVTDKIVVRLPRYDDHWMYLVKKDLGFFYYKDRDHKREYTLEEAVDLVEDAGWRVESAQNDVDVKIVATRRQANR